MPLPDTLSRKAAIITFVALLIISLFLAIGHTANFFLLVFGGILFSALLSSPANFIGQKAKISYGFSLSCVLGLPIALLGYCPAPTVDQQVE